jgi:hypothetical protein
MRLSVQASRAPTATLVVSTCATLAAIAAWWSLAHSSNDCALPGGLAGLAPTAQTETARHELACQDLEHGRITRDEYRHVIGVVRERDNATSTPVAVTTPATEAMEWASRVIAVSSEYSSTDWSAQQVLGPPDVYPGYGDNPKAWASKEADAPTEFIEVGFARPTSLRELRIYETLNAGAISAIDVVTVSGKHAVTTTCGAGSPNRACSWPTAAPAGIAQFMSFPVSCDDPVVSVRVTLASAKVAGWNEIDAIGGVACDAQP